MTWLIPSSFLYCFIYFLSAQSNNSHFTQGHLTRSWYHAWLLCSQMIKRQKSKMLHIHVLWGNAQFLGRMHEQMYSKKMFYISKFWHFTQISNILLYILGFTWWFDQFGHEHIVWENGCSCMILVCCMLDTVWNHQIVKKIVGYFYFFYAKIIETCPLCPSAINEFNLHGKVLRFWNDIW